VTLTVACSRWVEAEDLPTDCVCNITDDDVIDDVLDGVSDILTMLSGFAYYGVCTERTIRPCRGCWCGACPGCCEIDSIPLRGPVVSVDEVKIDGVVIAPSEYMLLSRNRLMRVSTDGARRASWPQNQHVWAEDTEVGTFSITYSFGHDPLPYFARAAAIELACDLLKTLTPNSKSRLPANATNVFFQGTQVSLQTRAEAVREGATYLTRVSGLLSAAGGRQAGVYSPDGLGAWVFPRA